MNKKEFISAYSEKLGETKKRSEELINGFLELIQNNLKKGKNIQFIGFGTFLSKNMPERNGVNPSSGEKIKIKARKVIKFKVGKNLQKTINL